MISTPLQVLVFSDKDCLLSKDYQEIITVAFQGGGSGYLAGATDTGVPVREFFAEAKVTKTKLLSAAQKTLAIILLTKAMVANDAMVSQLNKLFNVTSHSKIKLIVFDLEQVSEDFLRRANDLPENCVTDVLEIGEYALRRTAVGLIALHEATRLLSRGSKRITNEPRLFVSHAKIDGQSLATVLRTQIQALPGFLTFYDDDDLTDETDLQKALEKGVENSVLIVLRSEVFEDRPWCIQEMQWAEEYTSPYVVVDLRQKPITPPSKISFERAPMVRVGDGNLYRIIFIALREALRSRIHIRIVEDLVRQKIVQNDELRILVRQPTMSSIHNICTGLGGNDKVTIVYPDPTMTDGERAAAQALVSSMSSGSVITTPQTLCLNTQNFGAT